MKTVHLGMAAVVVALAVGLAAQMGTAPVLAAPNGDYVTGCTGEYFNNTTLAGSAILVRSDPAVNFYWPEGTSPGPGVATAYYSVRWTCTINVPTAGTYTFTMLTDDGMNLLVDGNLLTWAWYDQGPSSYSNSIYLGSGSHTIQVQYYNDTGGGTAQVYDNISGSGAYYAPPAPVYSPPQVYVPPQSYVPPQAYVPPAQVTTGFLTGCNGEYFSNPSLAGSPTFVRADNSINFYWPEGTSPGPGLGSENYSVRWTCPINAPAAGTYTFNAVSDDGMNVWVDSSLVIGAWFDQPPAPRSNTIYLNVGAHTVRVEYYNHTRGGTALVTSSLNASTAYYSPGVPGLYYPPAQTLPYGPGLLSGCTGEYFNNTTLGGSPVFTRSDGTVNFYWPEGTSPGPGVTVQYYSVRWTCTFNVSTPGTYTATILTDDGMNV
ncbi:MAG: PA14 domain-containing protein, partial [Chloroflexi bacterium]|nr:PA14 domain-containing protein [Chloroflexota bacterium]